MATSNFEPRVGVMSLRQCRERHPAQLLGQGHVCFLKGVLNEVVHRLLDWALRVVIGEPNRKYLTIKSTMDVEHADLLGRLAQGPSTAAATG